MLKRFSLMAATLLIGSTAFAQPPQGGFQGGGPGQGRGGFGGPGGPGGGFGGPGFMGGMNRTVSAATIPLRVMSLYLGLTDAQKGKIAEAREEMQDSMRPQMSRRNANSNDGPPRFDPEQMEAQRQSAEKKGTKEITQILSDAQRSKLNLLVKALAALQAAGIRSEAALKLNLTDDQLSRLAAMNANAASTRAETVLTDDQKDIAEDYKMPMGPPGGRGGFAGGGGPGGPGGPGGFGGPPGGGPGGPPQF